MKIQNILQENFGTQVAANPAPKIKFNDLDTLQVRTLQRIADGIIDVDSANDKEYDIMTDLAELGLLDQEYQLTKAGQKAVAIAKQLGGSAELLAAKKRQNAMSSFDHTNNNIDTLDNQDIDDIDSLSTDDGDEMDDDEFEFNLNQRSRPSF